MKTLIFLISIIAAILFLSGCKEDPAQPQTTDTVMINHQHDHANNQNDTAITDEHADSETEQTICPVMGGKVNKEIYTEYKGKKVYFCCPGCKPEFEKNPENYISKLPQFQN